MHGLSGGCDLVQVPTEIEQAALEDATAHAVQFRHLPGGPARQVDLEQEPVLEHVDGFRNGPGRAGRRPLQDGNEQEQEHRRHPAHPGDQTTPAAKRKPAPLSGNGLRNPPRQLRAVVSMQRSQRRTGPLEAGVALLAAGAARQVQPDELFLCRAQVPGHQPDQQLLHFTAPHVAHPPPARCSASGTARCPGPPACGPPPGRCRESPPPHGA